MMNPILSVYGDRGILEVYTKSKHDFTAVQISEAVRQHLNLASHTETEAEWMKSFNLRGEEISRLQSALLDAHLLCNDWISRWKAREELLDNNATQINSLRAELIEARKQLANYESEIEADKALLSEINNMNDKMMQAITTAEAEEGE